MKGKIHMIDFIFPTEQSREAVLSFYGEFENEIFDSKENVTVKRFWIKAE